MDISQDTENKAKIQEPSIKVGLTHYYCGDGKGKTTTLLGLIVRALGHGLRPILIQFLKRHKGYDGNFFMGEVNFLENFIEIKQFGSGRFLVNSNLNDPDEIETAQKGFDYAFQAIKSKDYDMVALDEVVTAVSLNLIQLDDLVDLIQNKPTNLELIITGMMYYKKLKQVSDYVISFNSISHPYNRGIMARKGIDY
jgi:cob(I)alamin adenosyltransferase